LNRRLNWTPPREKKSARLTASLTELAVLTVGAPGLTAVIRGRQVQQRGGI